MITCCRDCEERKMGCHATCEKYIAQQQENAARRDRTNAEKEINGVHIRYLAASKDRYRRNRR